MSFHVDYIVVTVSILVNRPFTHVEEFIECSVSLGGVRIAIDHLSEFSFPARVTLDWAPGFSSPSFVVRSQPSARLHPKIVRWSKIRQSTGAPKLMSRLMGPRKVEPQNLTGFPLPFF